MEDFKNLTEEEKIWYKKYIKYKTKYEELKQKGSGLITIGDADYKKIFGIEYIYSPIKYNNFTYDYTVAYFFIKIFNEGINKSEKDMLGGGSWIESIKYLMETIEKARKIRINKSIEDTPILEKYKKVILNYLLIILKLKNTLGINLESINIINNKSDPKQMKQSCTKMRDRLIKHHAKVNHRKKDKNDEDSLYNLYGPTTTYISRDKDELYCGFYIGLLICILHSDLYLNYKNLPSSSLEINNSLNHFFTKAEEKERKFYDLDEKINFDKRNLQAINVNYNFNKFKIPENFPEDLIDPDDNTDSRSSAINKELNKEKNKDFQFLNILYLAITNRIIK